MKQIGLIGFSGYCFCESVAITIDQERNVLSVIHLPEDEHSASGHQPSVLGTILRATGESIEGEEVASSKRKATGQDS